MIRLITLILILSTSVHAYTLKDININRFEFNRYVRPQLNSINKDYHTLLILLNPELDGIKPIFSAYKTIRRKVIAAKRACTNKTKKNQAHCQKLLEGYIKQFNKILILTKAPFKPSDSKDYNANEAIESFKRFELFKTHLYTLTNSLHRHALFIDEPQISKLNYADLKNEIFKSEQLFNLYVLKSIDQRFQSEFTKFWNDFIRPSLHEVILKHRLDYFIFQISNFNISWNSLNILLTKRGKVVSKPVHAILKTMHRRWVNVMKVSIRK